MGDLSSIAGSFSSFVLENPGLRLTQGAVVLLAIIDLYLLFYTLRDVLLRTRSLAAQFFAVLLVAALPILGFLLYLLVRPARLAKQRELEELLLAMLEQRRQEKEGIPDATVDTTQQDDDVAQPSEDSSSPTPPASA